MSESSGVPVRRRRTGLIVALVVVLALVAAAGAYAWSLNRKLDTNVTREALLPGQSASGAAAPQGAAPTTDANGKVVTPSANPSASATPSDQATMKPDGTIIGADGQPFKDEKGQVIHVPMAAGDPETGDVTQPTRQKSAGDSKNLLIIGTDSRGADRGRSDVMVLAHVSSDRSRVDLFHFPRDLWTNIPHQGYAKLNAAYEAGGAPRLVETMQPMIGVPIDHVALVNFTGFSQLTDDIGGVTIEGKHMNGPEALAWVRERKTLSQGDISRGKRQMAFIKTVLAQSLTPSNVMNPVTLQNLVGTATKSLTVDQSFSSDEIRSLAISMRNVRGGDIYEHTAPWSGVGWAGKQSIVTPAPAQMAKLRTALQNDQLAGYVDDWSPKHGFSR